MMGRGRRPCKDTEQPAAQLENAECVVWPNCSVLEAADQETAPTGMSREREMAHRQWNSPKGKVNHQPYLGQN